MNKPMKREPPWKPLGEMFVLKVWQLENQGGKDVWPEILLLRVTNSDYLKYAHRPKDFKTFLNENHLFSKDVIIVGPWVTLSSADDEPPPQHWILCMEHGKQSTVFVSALPELILEEEKKPKPK